MRLAFVTTLLLACSVSFAKVSPTTKPAAKTATTRAAATTQTSATTQPAALPTPAELIAKMKQMKAAKDALAKVAYVDVSGPIVEAPAGFSWFGEGDAATLHSLLDRLHAAREDEDVKAVLITLGYPGLGLAQAQEVRDALIDLRKAGKKTFVYADSYDTVGYTLASGATDVCLLGGGEILIPGIGGEQIFAKGLLDKLGVRADYVQIGEYKGADEQYTRSVPSDELRGEMNKLMDSLYAQIVQGIAGQRDLATGDVKKMIDETMLTAPAAKERGFVDHLVDQDGLRDLIAKRLNEKEIDLLHGYGLAEREEVDFSNPWAMFAALAKRPEPSDNPAVALIYADGMIVDGDGGDGMFGRSVGANDVRAALRTAARDEDVKAVVIRIDSPGGSALASEVMWQAARRVAEKKPLVISIGSMAASGGYYLASAGDHIFADPTSIVGSIGVVGGKFVLKGLYEKLGLTTESFHRGANAGLFSSNEPFDERQRKMITRWMTHTYDQFTQRVMSTRKGKIKDIDQVARGRIFAANQAKDLGMVDAIGGIRDAIAHAAEKAELEHGEYDVRVLPAPKTFADMLMGGGEAEATSPLKPGVTVGADSLLHVLPRPMRKALGQQVQTLQLLQDRPVALTAPFVLTVR